MKLFRPEIVLIEKKVGKFSKTLEILSRINPKKIEYIEDVAQTVASGLYSPEQNVLVLAKQEGKFFKPCPCTPSHITCGYYFLNLATNCTVGCSYCILQGYLNNPLMTVYTNVEDMFQELSTLAANPDKFYRIGTGELTDSLLLDSITGFSSMLMDYFKDQKNCVLELKTKTTEIDNLLAYKPVPSNIIISWSLNPEELIQTDEPFGGIQEERLAAALKCVKAGYPIAFHFDPIIPLPGWEEKYRITLRKMFEAVPPEKIVWISLGILRYPGFMHALLKEKHPKSMIFSGEMFPGQDGKMRFFRPFRQEVYKKMLKWIHEFSPETWVYLCMESMDVWKAVYGESFSRCMPLARCMDESVKRQLKL